MAQTQKMLGANGFKYQPKFGVIIVCKDEADQQAVFAQLQKAHQAQGRKVKVVSV